VVYLFGGVESRAKNSKVVHKRMEHREHDEFILVRASGEYYLMYSCWCRLLKHYILLQGSPFPRYIGQRTTSVPRLLVGYDHET
jgi:hypothetical protein